MGFTVLLVKFDEGRGETERARFRGSRLTPSPSRDRTHTVRMDCCRSVVVLLLLALLSVVSATAPNFQVRSITVASATDGPTEDEAMAAASVLKEDGVVVIKCSALRTLAPPSENAKDILASMISRVDKCGINHDHPFSFAEICHRAPRRYDVHLGAGLSESEFSMLVNSLVRPVLALLGVDDGSPADSAPARIVRDGLVTSLPGASAQPFHADGQDGRLFNAFLPLVAVRTQGTEFWLGSHADELAAQRLKRQGSGEYIGETILEDGDIAPRICSPILCRAEGIVLFDYRVIHRGRAHGAHEAGIRPVFYRVYATHGAEEDSHNWPKKSLVDYGA